MVFYIKSYVNNFFPVNPIQFKLEHGFISFQDIVLSIPKLSNTYSYLINPLLGYGHTQTAYTGLSKFENIDKIYYKRVILPIEDITYKVELEELNYDCWEGKSTIALDYVVPPYEENDDHFSYAPKLQVRPLPPRTEYLQPEKELEMLQNDKPLIIALHGLSGGSYESYIRAFLAEIGENHDYDAMVLNARGCANHTITSPQLFNGLWTNDLRYLINEHVSKKWPDKKVFLIGFSLGGAILANYLGQEHTSVYSGIKGAAIMGTPWDFPDSSVQLRTSLIGHNIYSPVMGGNLINLLNENYQQLSKNTLVANYQKNPEKYNIKYLKDFDMEFTSKLFGFNNADEYYRKASPNQRLLKVRVPTLIVSSLDDPITGSRCIPYNEVKLNPYLAIVTTTIGGHLGWFDLKGKRWYPQPVADLFDELKEWEVDKLSEDEIAPPPDLSDIWKCDRLVSKDLSGNIDEAK